MPAVSAFLCRGFNWYVPRYLRRHFHSVRVARDTAPPPAARDAIICFANHPAWWDPLIAFLLNQTYFPRRTVYAPIDDEALKRYPVFRRLGFYGIRLDTLHGARQFLATTRALLERPTTALWLTPGGQFTDVRARTTFQPGLAHLAATVPNVVLVPVAVEYTFWEERTPEVLVEFGQAVRSDPGRKSKTAWRTGLEDRLAETQASLAARAIGRHVREFDTVLTGEAGVGGWYDLLRRGRAVLSGTSFQPEHGSQETRV
jgi:1-acyl-sn-glycerol-3-phosphate acyltransferase